MKCVCAVIDSMNELSSAEVSSCEREKKGGKRRRGGISSPLPSLFSRLHFPHLICTASVCVTYVSTSPSCCARGLGEEWRAEREEKSERKRGEENKKKRREGKRSRRAADESKHDNERLHTYHIISTPAVC